MSLQLHDIGNILRLLKARNQDSALSDNLDTPRALNRIKLWCEESETNPCVDEGGLVARALDSLLGLAL